MKFRTFLILGGLCLQLPALLPAADQSKDATITGVTAIASKVSPDYVRAKQPDGKFIPETFAFGKGGKMGGDIKDATMDLTTFEDVARTIAPALAGQNFVSASDPAKTKLLIMVYWGTTAVPPPIENDPLYGQYQNAVSTYNILVASGNADEADAVLSAGLHTLNMANGIRDRTDVKNAAMLGYDASDLIGTDYGAYIKHTALRTNYDDQVAEIESNRYFVVLMAYDFQLLWKQKKHKLLWETRFSVNELHNAFDVALPFMAQNAAQYFGQPTKGLLRNRVYQGHVEIGAPTMSEFVPPPAK